MPPALGWKTSLSRHMWFLQTLAYAFPFKRRIVIEESS